MLQSITYLSVLTDKPSGWLGPIIDTSCLLSEDKILDHCVHEMLSNEKKEDYEGDSEKLLQSLIREDSRMWTPDWGLLTEEMRSWADENELLSKDLNVETFAFPLFITFIPVMSAQFLFSYLTVLSNFIRE